MANQGQIGAQKASASIAQQEKANQDAERKEAGNIQNLEREGEIQSRNLKKDLAATALGLSSADVQQTSSDIIAANEKIDEGISGVGSAVGSFAGGIG
jgi:peptidoglycan hydrolase-like amidase